MGFAKITVNKVLCTRLPPNPCVKGMGSAPAESDFLQKAGWGMEGDCPHDSTYTHYGLKGVGSHTRAGMSNT